MDKDRPCAPAGAAVTALYKFCGGCNPRFDRMALLARLRGDFPDVAFVDAADGRASHDLAVVICGCSARCASARAGSLMLGAEREYEALKQEIAKRLE